MSENKNNQMLKESMAEKKEYNIEKVIPKKKPVYSAVKRLFDIVGSLILGVILFPVMLILAVMIKIDSPGGVLFIQERMGKNGKIFKMVKFRTMRIDAETDGPQWAKTNDDRCTKLGRKLRKCRLDELPQLWNIFIGKMSFVGPRPERPYFYEKFEEYIHGFSNRLAVTPGLTGLAQVNGGYNLSPEEKVVIDMEYIKTRGLWLDIKILFRTFRLIFTHEGAR